MWTFFLEVYFHCQQDERYSFIVNKMKEFQYHLKPVASKHVPEQANALASPLTAVFSYSVLYDKAHVLRITEMNPCIS